ncbi:MAG: hypothetical protein OEY49_19905, partial [Candidatus Heimdallarchaeota archaeon]|nr:hypothetical protein [Candidatus Heimdallarchaeota archaeon]
MVIHKVKINHQIFRKSLIIFCLFLVLYATYTFQNFNKPDVIRLVESEEYQFEFTTYLQTQNSMDLDELNEFFAIHNQVEIKLQYYGDVYSQITNESKYSYVIDNYIDYEITYELNINPDLIDPRIKNELNTTELTNKLRGEIYDLWSDNSSNFDVEVLGSGIYTNQLQYNKNDVSYREILQDDFYLDYISIQILMILIWLVTIPVIYKRVYELFEFLRKNNHIRTGSTPVNQRTKIKWFNIYLRIYFILLIAFIILNVLIKTLSPYNILLSLNFSIIPILHTVIFFAVFYQTKNLNFVKVVSSFFGFIIALLLYLYFIGFHLLIHVFMIYVIYLACFSLGNFIFFGSRNSISDTEDINSLTRSEFNQITKTIYIDENFIRFVTSLVLAISVVSISISISFDIDFNIISGSNYQDLIFYLIYLILV